MKTPELDREKLKDAMHYVIALAGGRPGFGAVKLYKTLWFSDAKSWLLTQTPITGEEYVRQKHGPVPKHSLQTLTELEDEKRIKIGRGHHYDYTRWVFKALRPFQSNRLSQDEVKTLTFWANFIDKEHTAQSISDESHDYAWEIAKMGEPLPYYSFLASRLRDPTESELRKARSRMGSLGI
jgi:hypothetical protein